MNAAAGEGSAPSRPGSPARAWVRVLGSVTLLGLLAWFVDLRAIGSVLRGARPWPVGLAVWLTIPTLAVIAWRWRFTAGRVGVRISMARALREYYLSTLVNQVVPGGFGGDVARAVRVGAVHPEHRAAAVRSVVLDRLSGQVALWLVLFVLAATWSARLGGVMLLGFAGGTATLLVVLRVLVRRAPRGRLAKLVHDSLADTREAALSRGAWAVQLGASFASVALLVIMYGLCAVALGVDLSFPLLAVVGPAILAAMSLPISVGGWGVREVASAAAFKVLGADPSAGVAIGALFGAVNLVGALPGLLFLGRAQGSDSP